MVRITCLRRYNLKKKEKASSRKNYKFLVTAVQLFLTIDGTIDGTMEENFTSLIALARCLIESFFYFQSYRGVSVYASIRVFRLDSQNFHGYSLEPDFVRDCLLVKKTRADE